jgi:hypothetical protein
MFPPQIPNGAMMMRPPTRMVVGENGSPSHLPMRDPKFRSNPSKESDKERERGLVPFLIKLFFFFVTDADTK